MSLSKGDKYDLIDLVVRYLLIVLLGLGNLFVFYYVFGPLTIRFVALIVGMFSSAILIGNELLVGDSLFVIVRACIGGSAYYLLFILAMSTRAVKPFVRLKVVLLSFVLLYVFNVLRILFMIYISGEVYFDSVHMFMWYFVSTVFVVLVWLFISWRFEIRSIPVFSDLKYLYLSVIGTSKKKRKRRSFSKNNKR